MKTPIEALAEARTALLAIAQDVTIPDAIYRSTHRVIDDIEAVLRTARCKRCLGIGEVTIHAAFISQAVPCPARRKGEAS